MISLLPEIEEYWTKRAPSYSDIVSYELSHENESNWMNVIVPELKACGAVKILDIGTGPGFFATALARRGYMVTAVDYTQAMLDRARENAGELADQITYCRMDAHSLDFADESFDAVVTRNLTWNLEDPQKAYRDWFRVLKPGGVLLNFDAGWYNYLFDDEKRTAFNKARDDTADKQMFDFESYEDSDRMEEISRSLLLSRCPRPQADIRMLRAAGFSSVDADTAVWKRVWDEVEKVNFSATPMFMLRAVR